MFALRGWSGEALFASDSTASQLCDLTRGPPPSSALSIPYRAALLSASFRMHEAWLPAQHNSGSASHLATLNAEADSLARRGLCAASPWTLPWSALFHGRIVALHEGAIFLSPARAAEAAYAATTARTHALHLRPPGCPQAGPPTYSASRINAPRSRRWPSTASCTSGYCTPGTTHPATEG